MKNIMGKKTEKNATLKGNGWIIRSSTDGKILTSVETGKESQSRSRFLAVASLSAVPKKSTITQIEAERVVKRFIETQQRLAVKH
jgi:hypothetical protein